MFEQYFFSALLFIICFDYNISIFIVFTGVAVILALVYPILLIVQISLHNHCLPLLLTCMCTYRISSVPKVRCFIYYFRCRHPSSLNLLFLSLPYASFSILTPNASLPITPLAYIVKKSY